MNEKIYIDESGTMTIRYAKKHPFFVICLVKINQKSKFDHLLKKLFIYHKELFFQAADGRIELKGSKLAFHERIWLANYLNRCELIEVFYIKVSNGQLESKTIYNSPSLAFNYFICKDFSHLIESKKLPINDYFLSIDNRNVATYHLKSLEDYLNLTITEKYHNNIKFKVNYFDSKSSKYIQIADFFANLYFSQLMTGNYTLVFRSLIQNRVLKDEFIFPISTSIFPSIYSIPVKSFD